MSDTLNQKTGQQLYKEIAEDGRTDFSDEEAERAVYYCLEDYRTPESNYTAALVNATGGDWSGMLRNMLCKLRDQRGEILVITDEAIKTAITELDRIARDYDHFECGLPIYNEQMDKMVAAIRAILPSSPVREAQPAGEAMFYESLFEAACNKMEGKYQKTDENARFHDVGALRGYLYDFLLFYISTLPKREIIKLHLLGVDDVIDRLYKDSRYLHEPLTGNERKLIRDVLTMLAQNYSNRIEDGSRT